MAIYQWILAQKVVKISAYDQWSKSAEETQG